MFSDFNTPRKTSEKKEDSPSEDQEGDSEPPFDPDNTKPPPSPSTYSAQVEKTINETGLEVLSDQAMKKFQEVINSGGVPGVPKGTPVKTLFQQGIFYSAHSYSALIYLNNTEPQGSSSTSESGAKEMDKEPLPTVDSTIKSGGETNPGKDWGSLENDSKLCVWDPVAFNVYAKDTRPKSYAMYMSHDYPSLWGSLRAPGLEKRNAPFTPQLPFTLFPGRIVYSLAQTPDQPDHYCVYMETHFHEKKQKKGIHVLVWLPEQSRPKVSERAPEDVQLGSSFSLLNVNQVDWVRTAQADPNAISWMVFKEIIIFIEELSQLSSLPEIVLKSCDILPPNVKRLSKEVHQGAYKESSVPSDGDDANPIKDDKPVVLDKPMRNKKRPVPFTPSEPHKVTTKLASDFEDEQLEEIHLIRPDKKAKAASSSSAKGAVAPSAHGSSSVVASKTSLPSMTIPTGPVSMELCPRDRQWLSSEIKIAVKEGMRDMVQNLQTYTKDGYRTAINDIAHSVGDAHRNLFERIQNSVGAKQDSVLQQLNDVRAHVQDLGATPTFTWEQIVSQFEQYSKMFQQQQHQSSMGIPPSGPNIPAAAGMPHQSYPYGMGGTSFHQPGGSMLGGPQQSYAPQQYGMQQSHYPSAGGIGAGVIPSAGVTQAVAQRTGKTKAQFLFMHYT